VSIVLQPTTNVFDKIGHAIEPYFRKLGVDTKLVNGKIRLLNPYVACRAGQELTAEQCRVLKLIKIKVSKFRIRLVALWKNDGNFKILD